MNNKGKAMQDMRIDSEGVSDEDQLSGQDKLLQGTTLNDIEERQIKDGPSKFPIGLYVELIDYKHDPQDSIEFFPNFDLNPMITRQGTISLNDLIKNLKRQGFQLEGKFVSYYSFDCEMFINCGIEPIHQEVQISLRELIQKRLRLKFQSTGQSLIHMVMSEEMIEAVNTMKEGNDQMIDAEPKVEDKTSRRTKERRIGFIIDKVKKWRDYYNGKSDESGNMVRLTLDEAAKKVGISKKSLDDYLLQIRHGRKFAFNFNEHKNEKVGILRAFVKKHNQTTSKVSLKKSLKKSKKAILDSDKIDIILNNP